MESSGGPKDMEAQKLQVAISWLEDESGLAGMVF